jgi:uncharacterized protein
MNTPANPRRLNLFSLAKPSMEEPLLAGLLPIHTLQRLSESLHPQAHTPTDTLAWRVRRELRPAPAGHGEPVLWLHLEVQGQVALTCQRCLQAVEEPLNIQRSIRFVAHEQEALAEDLDSDEDVLALTETFDAMEWLEDECLLALPLVPVHDKCPQPLPLPNNEDAEETPHPFAALAQLKKTSGSGRA